MLNIKQLIAFVGVYEERSFSKAAKRLNATQSGLSMLTQQLEQRVNLKLFDRSPRGVVPTFAGHRLYTLGVDLIRRLDEADSEIRALSSGISGDIRVGLMPTFTRGVLAPALADFMADHRNVKVSIFEAYSAVLTDGVANGEFDFAIVPRAAPRDGIRTHLLGSDREILVCRPNPGLRHLAPVRLADLPPLKLVLPAKGNARRDAFDAYAELHGLRIATILNMDAMIATLEFVTHSDFVTILPETICVNDFDGKVRSLHPIVGPVLTVDYAVIEPSKSAMHPAAQLFLKRLEIQYRKLNEIWSRVAEGQTP